MKAVPQLGKLVAGLQQDGFAANTSLFRHRSSAGLANLEALA